VSKTFFEPASGITVHGKLAGSGPPAPEAEQEIGC